MGSIEQAVVDHFAEAGVHYEHHEEKSLLLAPFSLHSGQVLLVCSCEEENERLIVSALYPFRAPANRLAAVAEFFTRTNYGLGIGAFRLDYRDGECSFRCGIDVEGDRLTPPLVRMLVGCSLAMTDRYYTGLAAVAFGGISPAQALAAVDTTARPASVPADWMTLHGLIMDPQDRLN